jgi:hypothetical protein
MIGNGHASHQPGANDMDWVRLHVAINEVPAVGIGLGVLLLLASAVVGGRGLQKTAFKLFTIASVFGLLAFLTGAPAEVALQDAPGMSRLLVEQHRNAARLAVSVTVLLGLIAFNAITSMKQGRALSRTLMTIALFVSMASIASTGWAVYSGIRVHASEVRAQYLPHNLPDVKKALPGKKETPKKPNPVPAT